MFLNQGNKRSDYCFELEFFFDIKDNLCFVIVRYMLKDETAAAILDIWIKVLNIAVIAPCRIILRIMIILWKKL